MSIETGGSGTLVFAYTAWHGRVVAYNLSALTADVQSQFVTTSLALHAVAAPKFVAKDKPKVLLIISDDQGFGDFGFTGKSKQEE